MPQLSRVGAGQGLLVLVMPEQTDRPGPSPLPLGTPYSAACGCRICAAWLDGWRDPGPRAASEEPLGDAGGSRGPFDGAV